MNKELLAHFNCVSDGGAKLMASDYRQHCFDSWWWTTTIAVVAFLAVYFVGVLSGFTVLLVRTRECRDDKQLMARVGMMYSHYRPEVQYFLLYYSLRHV